MDKRVKLAVATPRVWLGDVRRNTDEILRLVREAAAADARVIVFPKEALSGASCGSLAAHPLMRQAVSDARARILSEGAAAGIEVVTPYLSPAVTAFSAKLPPEFKIHGRNRKRILKAAFADILPSDLAHRRKRGFGVPVAKWLRGHWKAEAEAALFDSQLCSGGFFVREELLKIWEAHQSGKSDFSYLIWSLLNLAWFIDRQ